MNATATDDPILRLAGVGRRYGQTDVVKDIELAIPRGSFTSILGPSGCGKSTLLRMIGGLTLPTSGSIEIDGEDVTYLPPQKRPTNTVFQSHGLFAHMSVRENVAFGLSLARRPRSEIDDRVSDALKLVRLDGFENRPVDRLSGGQQQRVALARALVMRPKILLLDEPLSALDLKLRQAMQEELRAIHQDAGGTFIFVTHDQAEAFALGDRLIVMNEGRIEQAGPPGDVYARPRSLFVADFVGDANFFTGMRSNGRIDLDIGICLDLPGPDGSLQLMLRPEAARLHAAGDGGPEDGRLGVEGKIKEIVDLGPFAHCILELDGGYRIEIAGIPRTMVDAFAAGNRATASWPEAAMVEVAP
ncbi:ATP-binding cassette domain-containing protein [Nitratireductor sp. CAU 1489]|uniref:ATP-binding cassette domain-containing protein n=1 Tax=Nitratireductor arenosus TaxID=2682096 RepID=A0A844QF73_9HYPH|nr:ABC transporter ATP-binding protein [Nitratireductor arenosus]MVA98616.1 ATP-binding cassette domain-containing protein [Nitratireductor arenosus]